MQVSRLNALTPGSLIPSVRCLKMVGKKNPLSDCLSRVLLCCPVPAKAYRPTRFFYLLPSLGFQGLMGIGLLAALYDLIYKVRFHHYYATLKQYTSVITTFFYAVVFQKTNVLVHAWLDMKFILL